MKCQESDRKLRLSLSNSSVKKIDAADVNDEFIDNDTVEYESIVGEDGNLQIETEERNLNDRSTIVNANQGAEDELTDGTSMYIFLRFINEVSSHK